MVLEDNDTGWEGEDFQSLAFTHFFAFYKTLEIDGQYSFSPISKDIIAGSFANYNVYLLFNEMAHSRNPLFILEPNCSPYVQTYILKCTGHYIPRT